MRVTDAQLTVEFGPAGMLGASGTALEEAAGFTIHRFPQVSSKTAVVTGPIAVGGWTNATPFALSRSNSAWTSFTTNEVAGIPSATIAG